MYLVAFLFGMRAIIGYIASVYINLVQKWRMKHNILEDNNLRWTSQIINVIHGIISTINKRNFKHEYNSVYLPITVASQ